MTKPEIIAQVRRCWYETAMAQAFRKAAGVQPEQDAAATDGDDREARYWERMMRQRIGALDRV